LALIVDASAIYAQAIRIEPRHADVIAIIRSERESLVTSELAAAEADDLILDRLGIEVELDFLEDLAAGTFVVECLTRDELRIAREVVERYRDVRLGLADASLVVLARRHGTHRILSFDEGAFRAVTPLQGGSFTVLPADSSVT
jgi:predicted nucleic acid-binding protein